MQAYSLLVDDILCLGHERRERKYFMSSTSRIPGVPYAPVVIAMSDRSLSPSWWRVWSNGWCEQGGQATPSYGSFEQVSFPIPMNDTSYNCSCVCSGADNDCGNVANENIDVRTVRSIAIRCNDTASSPSHPNNKVFWEIKGWLSDEALAAIKQGKVWSPNAWNTTAHGFVGAWVDPS